MFPRLLDSHIQDLGYGFAFILDLQGLPVVAGSFALLAFDINIRQEVHLDLDQPIPMASLAPSALHIEGEATALVASHSGLLGLGKGLPDRVEDLGVGRRIGSRRPSDGALINDNDFIDLRVEQELVVLPWSLAGPVDLLHQSPVESIVDQCGLARSRDSGDGRQDADGNSRIYILQIILPASYEADEGAAFSSAGRNLDPLLAG